MAMLEIRGVHKSFHTYAKPDVHPGIFGRAPKPTSSLDVLRGVDLTVEKGDVVAILGPSGSGKTTLLRCLNFLETADAGNAEKDISLYINSPGGSVTAGFAIYDTMQFIKCDVSTICMGIAASMGAFLFAAGAKGKRLVLPNSEVMIHQPLGGAQGQATEIKIAADHILKTRERINRILAENMGKPIEFVERETERDNFLTAEEAVEYGLADKIIYNR